MTRASADITKLTADTKQDKN